MTKKQAISQMILRAIAEGKTEKEAIDMVLGKGTFDKLASDVYDKLSN